MKITIELTPSGKPDAIALEELFQWLRVVEGTEGLPVPAFLKEVEAKSNGELIEPDPAATPTVDPNKRIRSNTDITKTTKVQTLWGEMTAEAAAEKAGFSLATLKNRFAKGGKLSEIFAPATRGRKPAEQAEAEPDEDPVPPVVPATRTRPPGVERPATPSLTPSPMAQLALRDEVRSLINELREISIGLPASVMHAPQWMDKTEKPVWETLPGVADEFLPRLKAELEAHKKLSC